jgi:pimeloyl-ACP methyl ester carboxylesterase
MTVRRAWVLLHGTPLDPDVWADLRTALGQQPVHAPIATPTADGKHPQLAVARRLVSELPAVADRWDVVGHSFGGQIAIELALLAPDRVASLSLICSRDTPFPPFSQTASDLRSGAPIDVESALRRWFRPEEQQSGGRLVSYARDRLTNADRPTWAAALDGIAAYNRSADVHLIEAPTMLICAQLDPVSDPSAMESLASRLTSAEFHLMTGAAHMSPFLDIDALANELTRHATTR